MLDGLGYLQGKDVDFVNKKATDGVLLAHTDVDIAKLMYIASSEQRCLHSWLPSTSSNWQSPFGLLECDPKPHFDQPGVGLQEKYVCPS